MDPLSFDHNKLGWKSTTVIVFFLLGIFIGIGVLSSDRKEPLAPTTATPPANSTPEASTPEAPPNGDWAKRRDGYEREYQDHISRLRLLMGDPENQQVALQIDGLTKVAAGIHDASYERCKTELLQSAESCLMFSAAWLEVWQPRYVLDNIHTQDLVRLRTETGKFISSFDRRNERIWFTLGKYKSDPRAREKYHHEPQRLQEMLDMAHKYRDRAESELDSNVVGAYIDIHTADMVHAVVLAKLSQYMADSNIAVSK